MTMTFLLPLLLIGVGFFYTRTMSKKRAAALGPAIHQFLERTGYRYADVPSPDLALHVARGEAVFQNLGKGYQARLIRQFHGAPIHNVQEGHVTSNGWSTNFAWVHPLAGRPRVLLQVAERSLSGVGKAVKEAFSNTHRHWQPIYPHQVPIADPELAQRLVCYSPDPHAAQLALSAPGMKELLLRCAEVDLTVLDAEVRFADPFQKNLMAAGGGTAGALMMRGDVQKWMDLQIPVHDHIAALLATTAQAVR
jgi:hypothetical protein